MQFRVKIIIVFLLFILGNQILAQLRGEGVNTLGSVNGFLVDVNYSIAPVSSMSPKPAPISLLGCGISMVSNETLRIGVMTNISVPTSKYTTGYTLEADTINIDFSSWDIRMSVGYLFQLDQISSNISPVLDFGYGKIKVNDIDYYREPRKILLETSNIVLVEPGIQFNYTVSGSFVLSLGVSYQITVPDRLMINYSSSDLNMLKLNAGISFGIMQENGGRGYRRRR